MTILSTLSDNIDYLFDSDILKTGVDDVDIKNCKCGKEHLTSIKNIIIGSGVIEKLPEELNKLGVKKAFILTDKNEYEAAGNKVVLLLEKAGVEYEIHIFEEEKPEPDEYSVGSAVMHFDNSCDAVVAVGSGVVNDIGKILANISQKLYIIVATAPSMDGYASSTSSMSVDGLKASVNSKCADIIIGDTDILKNAPINMLKAGIGDMLAKYISICEWRISNLITGEYYCETVADLVRQALKKCTDNADKLLERSEKAVEAVFEGLIIGGVAMSYVGVSRPASGVEHYFSHIWDMRGLGFGTRVDLHGIQCAVATLLVVRLYEKLKNIVPDKEKALKYAKSFDLENWNNELRAFLGKGAEAMILLEEKEGKYNLEKHEERLNRIIGNWDGILEIINEELPDVQNIEKLLGVIDISVDCDEYGIDKKVLPMTFKATKDIRDKYVLSRLCWDLGIIDEMF